jgi:hypothetical protein
MPDLLTTAVPSAERGVAIILLRLRGLLVEVEVARTRANALGMRPMHESVSLDLLDRPQVIVDVAVVDGIVARDVPTLPKSAVADQVTVDA